MVTRCVPWLDGMDCHRSSCLAGDVSCAKQQAVIPKRTKSGVPAMVDAVVRAPTAHRERKAARCKAKAYDGVIEIEVDGITIRAGRGADTAMIASIVQALKASR